MGWGVGSLGICLLDNNPNEIITSIDILESQVKNCQAILSIFSLQFVLSLSFLKRPISCCHLSKDISDFPVHPSPSHTLSGFVVEVVGIEHKSSSVYTFLIARTNLQQLFIDSLVQKGQRAKFYPYHTEEALSNHLQNRLSSTLLQTLGCVLQLNHTLLHILCSNTDDGSYLQRSKQNLCTLSMLSWSQNLVCSIQVAFENHF